MISTRTEWSPRGVRDRRHEVKQILARHGRLCRPSRLVNGKAAAPENESFIRRLSTLLLQLGGLFPYFGLYLSSRPDLLDAGECDELARLREHCTPASAAAVHDVLAVELGRPPADVFAELDPLPWESSFVVQVHRARLRTGELAVVELVHPNVEVWIDADLELLPLLADAFASRPELPLPAAIVDFEQALASEIDLAASAAAMEALAGDPLGSAAGIVPQVFRPVTGGRVLTYQRFAGVVLLELPPPPADGHDLPLLARRLCAGWLGQVLIGAAFPVVPRSVGLVALADDRVASGGGSSPRCLPPLGRICRATSSPQVAMNRTQCAPPC